MADVLETFKIRQKYRHFRVLVIGQANAGKTTLLKRVCNTTKDPIYEERNLLLSPSGSGRGIALTPLANHLEPTSAVIRFV